MELFTADDSDPYVLVDIDIKRLQRPVCLD